MKKSKYLNFLQQSYVRYVNINKISRQLSQKMFIKAKFQKYSTLQNLIKLAKDQISSYHLIKKIYKILTYDLSKYLVHPQKIRHHIIYFLS